MSVEIALGVGSDAGAVESSTRKSSPWRSRRWNWASGLSGSRWLSRRGWGPKIIDIDLDLHVSVEDRYHESDRFAVHGDDLTFPRGEWSCQDECTVAWLCCGPHGLILSDSRRHGLPDPVAQPCRILAPPPFAPSVLGIGSSSHWDPSRRTAPIDLRGHIPERRARHVSDRRV